MADSVSTERKPLLVADNKADEIENPKPTGCKGVIRRLLLSDENPDFALSAEIAIRGAIFVCITGLPLILPPGLCGPLDIMKKHGMYAPGVITFFVYNYSPYLGDVICGVTNGLRGTTIAVLNTWMMYSIFPTGVTKETPDYVWWAGMTNGVIFIFCMFFFNFSISTTIFTVSNFVFFWMDFMDMGSEPWLPPWSPDFDILDNLGMHAIFTLAVGGILAIAGTLFPYPMLAIDSARDIAEELNLQMPHMWRLMFDYFSEDIPNVYMQDKVHRRLRRLEGISTKLGGMLSSAWWECLGLGKRNTSRRMMRALDEATQASYDRIKGAWIVARAESWSASHVKMMSNLRPSAMACIDMSEQLIGVSLAAAKMGELDDKGAEELITLRKKLGEAADKLTQVLRTERQKMADADGSSKLSKYCLEEHMISHMLCVNICAFVRHNDRFAGVLLDQRTDPGKLPAEHACESIRALCSGLLDRNNIMFMVRGCTSIFVGFALGYFGAGELVGKRTANVACTVAVLQSRFLGSALVKNLGRIQGVVLGSLTGEIVRSMFPTCSPMDISLTVLVVLLYSLITLFIYHNSVQYSYIGCLLCAFGIQKMLSVPCVGADEEMHIDKVGGMDMLISTVIAVFIIVLNDFIIWYPGTYNSSRASDKAMLKVTETYNAFQDTVNKVFDKSTTTLTFHKAALLASIEAAESMGAEAYQEPRYWRTEWKHETYQEVIRYFRQIRFALAALEYSCVEGNSDGAPKNQLCTKLEALTPWQKLGNIIGDKMKAVEKLLPIFVHDSVNRFHPANDEDAKRSFSIEKDEIVTDIIDEVSGLAAAVKDNTTLEEDPICELCMIIGSCAAIFTGVRGVQRCILRA